MITTEELDFLRESNNIEEEWDDKSLQDAMLAWQYIKPKKKLTKDIILETHRILMRSRDTIPDEFKGRFRNGVVYIGGKQAKPHYAIDNLLDVWLDKVNEHLRYDSPFTIDQITQELHVQYEGVHPFFDGNGRTGRIFYNWQRVRMGFPIHVIEAKTKYEKYYTWFT